MATDKPVRTGSKESADADRTGQQARQETVEQRQDAAMQQRRADPSAEEAQMRREQGGHDRPVGADHVPRPRPRPRPADGDA